METTLRKDLLFLFFSFLLVRSRSDGTVLNQNSAATSRNAIPLQANDDKSNGTRNDVVVNNKGKNNGGGGGGGGGAGWGWGGGGGGGNRRGGWGWGSGGGGGIYWRWGCNGHGKRGRRSNRKRVFPKEDYKIGEFAQCMLKGRCKGMRLDCPLHCGGSCFYDCRFMCKAHCKRY